MIVQKTLGRTVEVHDDGSAPGMYDLRIGPEDAPEVAIECVGAVDPVFTELWNIGPATCPWILSLSGDWTVGLSLGARVRKLQQSLESVLQELEARQIWSVCVDDLESFDAGLYDRMKLLCITDAHSELHTGGGRVYLILPGGGGTFDEQGTAVPGWLSEFLRDPDRADVLKKLERSRALQRQAFVIAAFGGPPWPVASYLFRGLDHVPATPPDLPVPLTAAWVVPDHPGHDGLYWDGVSWRIVSTAVES